MKMVYLIGIGGIGMSALARYYNHNNYLVAGHEKTASELTQNLDLEGIIINYSDAVESIPLKFRERGDIMVIYTPAIPANSVQLNWFKNNGYQVIKRSQALGHIASGKKSIAIAGTHGKTTISTMVAHTLQHSQEGCTAFLGGISVNYNTNLLLNSNNILVAEADEYDRSFLQLWPHIAVITSADADHLDIYNSHQSVLDSFATFASQVSSEGALIVKKGLESSITREVKAKVYTYSFNSKCDFYASSIDPLGRGLFSFTLHHPKGVIEKCSVGTPGWVNVENGIAAAAAALLHGTSPLEVKRALATFKGVKRRFETVFSSKECSYIDDYAHHPNELSAAISSIRDIFPSKRVTVVFQPHLYSRTRDFAEQFAQSLSLADELILMDIYPARELPIEGVTSSIILDRVTLENKLLIDKEGLLEELQKREFEVLITFGAGDIGLFVSKIEKMLKERYNG